MENDEPKTICNHAFDHNSTFFSKFRHVTTTKAIFPSRRVYSKHTAAAISVYFREVADVEKVKWENASIISGKED